MTKILEKGGKKIHSSKNLFLFEGIDSTHFFLERTPFTAGPRIPPIPRQIFLPTDYTLEYTKSEAE